MLRKRSMSAPQALNEAYEYAKPSTFSRGIRLDVGGASLLFVSGTASIDEHGVTVHVGDFRKQLERTLSNLTALLAAEGATWKDVVRTSCYLKHMERDYAAFNEVRKAFYDGVGLDPYPASTAIQAELCRPELLVEIELIAALPNP